MTRIPNAFLNPATGDQYLWPVNHLEEGDFGKTRNVEHTAPTGQSGTAKTGLVRQQGEDSPLIISLKGTILDDTQHAAFLIWQELSRTQTIRFRDFDGETFEVIITSYKPRRERVGRNPRTGKTFLYRYDLTMEVVNCLGPLYAGTYA